MKVAVFRDMAPFARVEVFKRFIYLYVNFYNVYIIF